MVELTIRHGYALWEKGLPASQRLADGRLSIKRLFAMKQRRYDYQMQDLLIRSANKADLPGLLSLYTHLDPDDKRCSLADASAILDRFLQYEGSVVLVGVMKEELVATCTLIVIPNLTRGGMSYALIENVVTHINHRGAGFGRTILSTAVERAWEAGCYKVMLMTGSKKPSTLAFYKAAGFEQSKTGFQIRRVPSRHN